MARLKTIRQFADQATRPVADFVAPAAPRAPDAAEIFVWFEDGSTRRRDGQRPGAAGLPESLLPWPQDRGATMQVIDRHYVEGHLHLLSAVRLRVDGGFGERIAALYTAALSVGTVAWIGTGDKYARAWDELYGVSPSN